MADRFWPNSAVYLPEGIIPAYAAPPPSGAQIIRSSPWLLLRNLENATREASPEIGDSFALSDHFSDRPVCRAFKGSAVYF